MPLHGEQSGGEVIVQQLNTVNALAIDFDSELLVWSELDERGGGVSVSDFNGLFFFYRDKDLFFFLDF